MSQGLKIQIRVCGAAQTVGWGEKKPWLNQHKTLRVKAIRQKEAKLLM